MQYFFELGNFKGLSQAELSVVLETFGITKDSIKNFSERIFIIDNKELNDTIVKRIFNRLGGFIRAGVIIDNLDDFLKSPFEGKVVFGLSYIGDRDFDTKKFDILANDLKKYFKDNGHGSRFILPKKTELNAAQVTHNAILRKGFELCILENDSAQLYGKTLAIQDIDSFSHRDFNKPGVDTDMGMLPPKLARIMCNLTGLKAGTIWDPFCGSGTIPMEAAILGYNVLASDISEEAIKSTEENLVWLSEKNYISDILYETFQLDITKPRGDVLKKLQNTEIDAVVFEPYMGPPQTSLVTPEKAQILLDGVKDLYVSLLDVFEKTKKRGFTMVAIIPSYKTVSGWKTIGISEIFGKRWSVVNKKYSPQDLKWERNNSIISRNIFILERN
jgi:tRNA G10  N-methylase Trm11